MSTIINELEALSQKIENDTATLEDYKHYEELLLNGGLSHKYIYSYLNRAGFNNWEEFVNARKKKQNDKAAEAALVGGLIGLGLGILLIGLFSKNKE